MVRYLHGRRVPDVKMRRSLLPRVNRPQAVAAAARSGSQLVAPFLSVDMRQALINAYIHARVHVPHR
jgi:hypothetical protein